MPCLTIADFNTSAFFGQGSNMLGGYGHYPNDRWENQCIVNPAYFSGSALVNSQWYARLQRILEHGSVVGKKVVDLGCAFGHMVAILVDQGADAYGIDFAYPISQAQLIYPELASRFIVGDVRTWLPTLKRNDFDLLLGRGIWDCFSDADLAAIIPHCNNVAKFQQIYSVDPTCSAEYYYPRTLAQYQAMGFEPGTIFMDDAS